MEKLNSKELFQYINKLKESSLQNYEEDYQYGYVTGYNDVIKKIEKWISENETKELSTFTNNNFINLNKINKKYHNYLTQKVYLNPNTQEIRIVILFKNKNGSNDELHISEEQYKIIRRFYNAYKKKRKNDINEILIK